jgi:hypothetical protein
MGIEYTFYDYIDVGGINRINAWLNGEGRLAKAFFNHIISNLEASPPPKSKDSVWHPPYTIPMKRQWKDFIEIRKTGSIQYRLICKMENREVFLVATGFHKGSYETDITPETTRERVTRMKNNPERYRREHDRS